jgi:flagellar export protein FliJ
MNGLGTIGKVLQLKEQREDEIENEVRELRNVISAHQAHLARLEDAYMDTLEVFNGKRSREALAAHEIGIYYSYLFHLTKEMEEKKREIAGALSALDARREALVEAHKETKVVESLKEKRSRECVREEARRERREMDFISATRGLER